MSTVSYALTTATKVKAFYGVTDTSLDVVIDALINAKTDFIESFCGGRRFLKTTYTREVYDSMGGRSEIGGSIIFLKQFPITALTTVEYRAGTATTPTWTTYDSNGYLLYGNSGYVKFYSVIPHISQGLAFTYDAGYLIDFTNETDITKHTLPFDLTQACTDLVLEELNLRKAKGIKAEMTEGQRVEFFDRTFIDPSILEVLRKYQTVRMSV